MDFFSDKLNINLGISDIKNNFMSMINDFNNLEKEGFFNENQTEKEKKKNEKEQNTNNNNNENDDDEEDEKKSSSNSSIENDNKKEEEKKEKEKEEEENKNIQTKETIIENPPSLTKTFKLNSNITNNEYRITFDNKTEKLYLYAIQSEIIPEKRYETEIQLSEIKENQFFSMCEDFNSFMNQINWFIDQKKCEVIENESNLILKIFLPINTIKEIVFTMKLKIKNSDELIQELFKQIIILREEDQRNKRLIKLLFEKINLLEKKISGNNNNNTNNTINSKKIYNFY